MAGAQVRLSAAEERASAAEYLKRDATAQLERALAATRAEVLLSPPALAYIRFRLSTCIAC